MGTRDVLFLHLLHLGTKIVLVRLPSLCLQRVILQQQLLQLMRGIKVCFFGLSVEKRRQNTKGHTNKHDDPKRTRETKKGKTKRIDELANLTNEGITE